MLLRTYIAALCAALHIGCATTAPEQRAVTILHFSDYHSHAVPFFHDGVHDMAGIARAYEYLEPLATRDDVLVFNGGDTMNLGAPPWSDKFQCIEWGWWNGIVDAMAFGNHDADYGAEVFAECREQIRYPILGANVADPSGEPLFRPYEIFERDGVRIGAFALAGSDFGTLLRETTEPVPGVQFLDRAATAREMVRRLREDEQVDAVVLIGHASTEDDEVLARQVAGIDLILGTHSHRLEPLRQVDGTSTWIVSPGQYLTHISSTTLKFENGSLAGVDGELVPMEPSLPEDPQIAALVDSLQTFLEYDNQYGPLFLRVGTLDRELLNRDVNLQPTPLGSFVMDLVREAAEADLALSTSSSFRGGLPAGTIREVDLREVLPYDNTVVRVRMTGAQLRELLERAEAHRGTDSFAQISGSPEIDPTRTYTVATTDYLAKASPAYRDLFTSLEIETTELKVRSLVRQALGAPV